MQYKIFRLTFRDALHIGSPRADYDKSMSVLHSDTLYAALTRMWALAGIPIDSSPYDKFAVSSLFPFAEAGEKEVNGKKEKQFVYFFPKPYYDFRSDEKKDKETDPADRKRWKKVQWYDTQAYEQLLSGAGDFETGQIVGKNFLVGDKGKVDILGGADFELYQSQVVLRNKVSRIPGEDTKPFYVERLYFSEGCGLWFLLAYEDDGVTLRKVEKALEILGDEGIGTDRNVGMGQFEYLCCDKTEDVLPTVNDANAITALSLYCPENSDEIKDKKDKLKGYELTRRGGWITDEGLNTFRKKSVYMFKEGSVFGFDDKKDTPIITKGNNLIDVTPQNVKNHRVLRCGKAIFLPCKIQRPCVN